jgi:arylsulfatase A-like enzyme
MVRLDLAPRRFLLPALAVLLAARPAAADDAPKPAERPNVLFIAVDDLNHWVHYLGRNEQVKTPNLDRIARRGLRFTHAYAAAPVCNPSRAALMSGLLPSTSGVYDNGTDWRKLIPPELPLTTSFRKAGYWVGGAGKVYHEAYRRDSEWDDYLQKEGGDPKPKGDDTGVGGIKFAPLDCRDEDMQDYRIVSWAIDQLGKKHDRPFFLACGVHKPHMPWNVPQKWYDLYPLDGIKLPPVLDTDLDDVPPVGVQMAKPWGDHAAIVKSGRWKDAVRGYLAAISFTDMNVGRLLDALDRSPYRDNTIVVIWGDHGWHLGEKLHWRKFTLWEEATRAPLIWIAPGVTKPDTVCDRTVDFMSIYPTLCDLCRLETPKHVEGVSIRTLLEKPDAPWDRPARTTYLFNNHAVRTEKWRYIRYHDGGEELYDEVKDPLEWTNLAKKPEYADVKAQLAKHLPAVNKPAPKGSLGDEETPKTKEERKKQLEREGD